MPFLEANPSVTIFALLRNVSSRSYHGFGIRLVLCWSSLRARSRSDGHSALSRDYVRISSKMSFMCSFCSICELLCISCNNNFLSVIIDARMK